MLHKKKNEGHIRNLIKDAHAPGIIYTYPVCQHRQRLPNQTPYSEKSLNASSGKFLVEKLQCLLFTDTLSLRLMVLNSSAIRT